MVSPLSLYLFAAATTLLAGVVSRLSHTSRREAWADAAAALAGTSLLLVTSTILFGLSLPLAASTHWQLAGGAALLASPLGATIGLRIRGRRSVPRALLGSGLGWLGVFLWLNLNLRGPRGGWTLLDVAIVLPAATLAVAAAACLGWWSKRTTVSPSS